jgi:hypothetical protein
VWLKLLYKILFFKAQIQPARRVCSAPLFVAAVFKNESPFLKEWLDFHLEQGVSCFYLADNFSDDKPIAVLQPYINRDQVRLFSTTSKGMNTRLQAQTLNSLLRFIKRSKSAKAWVAVIDVDEYLFNPQGKSILELLSARKGQFTAAVLVNWFMFGTSKLRTLEANKTMRSQLTWRAHSSLGEHKMVKPIVYLANVTGFLEGPHRPFSKGKSTLEHSDGLPYSESADRICHDPLRINHYWYRSENYYNTEKRRKRQAFGDVRSGKREADHIKACNYEQDFSILELQSLKGIKTSPN